MHLTPVTTIVSRSDANSLQTQTSSKIIILEFCFETLFVLVGLLLRYLNMLNYQMSKSYCGIERLLIPYMVV